MSAKDRDRLKVLHEVHKRHIPQRQAAVELGVSEHFSPLPAFDRLVRGSRQKCASSRSSC